MESALPSRLYRSGIQGVWISADDGSNLVQISNPHDESGSPQWSPDGNKIAFDSRPRDHWEIYVADVAEGKPRKLVTNISERNSTSLVPRWKVDLFQIQRTWQNGSLSLSRRRRRGHCTLSRYRWAESAGVFRWEDSVFCKQLRENSAEESVSASIARYGVRRRGWDCLA
jgi:dipeptidyl aminopeptidase/acylaminoacyl peptidase